MRDGVQTALIGAADIAPFTLPRVLTDSESDFTSIANEIRSATLEQIETKETAAYPQLGQVPASKL